MTILVAYAPEGMNFEKYVINLVDQLKLRLPELEGVSFGVQ